MSQANETPVKTFQAGVALKANRLVILTAGKLAYAAADSETTLGSTEREAFAADEFIGVRSLTSGGFSRKLVAAAAFAKGAILYQAADGKVDDSGTIRVGVALEASGDVDHIVEVAPSQLAVDGTDGTDGTDGATWVTAPVAADSTGTAGQIAYDTGYIYVCTATDTWKRVAIATWP